MYVLGFKGNKTLSYNPESRNWKAISTDEEFARARVFTSIYNDELARLKEEYGEKRKEMFLIANKGRYIRREIKGKE